MCVKIKYGVIVLFLMLFITVSKAQTFMIQADKDFITIGDPITLTLTLTKKDKQNIEWPPFFKGDSLPDGFEILEVLPQQASNNQKNVVTQQITITSFEPGNYKLQPFVIQDTGGVITSNILSLVVSLFPVDTTQDFRDIKPIMEPEMSFQDNWYGFIQWLKNNWYWVLIAIILLAVLSWLILKKKKTKGNAEQTIVKTINKEPAHIKALHQLGQLNKEKPWQNGSFKDYNTKLYEIMRGYIRGRYTISTKEKTTAEILSDIEKQRLSENLKNNIKHLLTLSDLVKFAKQEPTAEQCQQILDDAIDFVNQTKLTS